MRLSWINSKNLLLLIFISVTWVNFNQERWHKAEVISDDVSHYYSYLPAFFYEHDLKLQFLSDDKNLEQEKKYYAPNRTEKNEPVIKMSMGHAIGLLPFFTAAHVTAHLSGLTTDGFSPIYQFAVQFSSLVYYLFAIFFLAKLLTRYFREKIVTIVLFTITFGTNVFYYLTIRAGNVHTYDFFLVSVFLYVADKTPGPGHLKKFAWMGVLLGLLTITRPINLLFVIIPCLIISNYRKGGRPVTDMLLKKINQLLLAVLVFTIVVMPQMLYWRYVTGHYIYNSYINEGFFFDDPHLIDGLFSFRKGWFIYTPVMILPVIGLFKLNENVRKFRFAIWCFLPLYLYVTFSWWCWWYGGSYGQRALIDIYPLLAIPFCSLLSILVSKPVKILIGAAMALLVALNLFQTMQAKYNILHYDSMTWAAYKRFFLITTGIPDRETYLLHPDYEKALRGEDEYPAGSRVPAKK